MRALSRHFLAPLIVAAAALTAGPAYLATGAPAVHSAALARQCPPGTNWDTIKQACT
jgi:hypothetical protein